jgi:prepilin-type N-terminal cleavage/methylation domain-containing protein/prepilin-type processing-associated H-X9-DG protein
MSHAFSRNRTALSHRRGFTLIELLVVIAIITIIAAILFPVFARARENARRASCQSNLKQIALGIKQYMQDYDEYFPMVASYSYSGCSSSNPCGGWAVTLQPYLKSEQIFQCPSQPNRDSSPFFDANNAMWGYSDYFYNSNLGMFTDSSRCANGRYIVKEAAVDYSANVVMLGDGGRGGQHNFANAPPQPSYATGSVAAPADNAKRPGAATYVPGWYTVRPTDVFPSWDYAFTDGKYLNTVNETHLGGMNIAFVDGHVKWYKPEKLTFDNPNGSNATFKVNDINAGLSAAKPGCTP